MWKKLSTQKATRISCGLTIEALLALMERLGPDQKDTNEFCRKALWSYVNYDDDSEWSSRAKQHCMKELSKNKRNKAFTATKANRNNTARGINHRSAGRNKKGRGKKAQRKVNANVGPVDSKAGKKTARTGKKTGQ